MKPTKPGQRVRLTGKFLRNTGQIAGGEGQSRWVVVACQCGLCQRDFVAVDEMLALYPDEPPAQRHFASANLEVVA